LPNSVFKGLSLQQLSFLLHANTHGKILSSPNKMIKLSCSQWALGDLLSEAIVHFMWSITLAAREKQFCAVVLQTIRAMSGKASVTMQASLPGKNELCGLGRSWE
jgi:hypothetical protein